MQNLGLWQRVSVLMRASCKHQRRKTIRCRGTVMHNDSNEASDRIQNTINISYMFTMLIFVDKRLNRVVGGWIY